MSAKSNDMMTSGDACPTTKGNLKVAAKGSLIYEPGRTILLNYGEK